MSWQQIDARFPWIELFRLPQGGAVARDARTNEQVHVQSDAELAHFVATHSAASGYGGLGDAVRGITQRLGFGECTPCAKRQAMLNGLAPRVFRRR